jgi:MFS transporter, DHA2 family, multidrug resistance protein
MATETAHPNPSTPPAPSAQMTTNPYIGILGVFLGAATATMNSRLLSIGLPDLRGALALGFDEASWIPTALNMGLMFMGPFSVFLSAVFGPRRILLISGTIFAVVSILLPLSPSLAVMLALEVVAGLASGTFYSLTLTFVLTALPKRLIIFGIAAYAADIVFASNIASAWQAWYAEHLSWHWIFWNAALFTPLMMVCVYFGIPRRIPMDPRPNWRGFVYFSLGLSLLYAALDQGERLDWLNSGVIVALLASGAFLVAASWARRMRQPNPLVNISFVMVRNAVILAFSIFVFKFVHLAAIQLIPGFLGTIHQYRPLEIGRALAWVAVPQFAVVWLVAVLVIHTNSRLILAAGLTISAGACWYCAHLDSSWAGSSFPGVELVLAAGLACVYIGLVGSLVLQALEMGALKRPADVATFSGFMHTMRIFGGQVGVALMARLITVRERFHSNLLGLHVQTGNWLTEDRLRLLTAGLLPASTGPEEAQARAVGLLSQQVRTQAYTLATADGFVVLIWAAVAYLLLMLFLRPGTISYKDLRTMQ